MSIKTDARTLLQPRSALARVEDRLIRAGQRAQPVTLSLREASILLTYFQAARRLARTIGPERDTDAAVRLELAKTDAAWRSAERRILDLERTAVLAAAASAPHSTTDDEKENLARGDTRDG